MPPDPHNSLICYAFLALAAAGPRQCERLEPPVCLTIRSALIRGVFARQNGVSGLLQVRCIYGGLCSSPPTSMLITD